MPDLWELGPAALGASGAGHWLAKAVQHADLAGDEHLANQLRDLRERVDAVHLEIARLRCQPSDDAAEAA